MGIRTSKLNPGSLLELSGDDFLLAVHGDARSRRAKAEKQLGAEALRTSYRWAEGTRLFLRDGPEAGDDSGAAEGEAVFFENTRYEISVEFEDGVTDIRMTSPAIGTADEDEAERDSAAVSGTLDGRRRLDASVNYGNDVGHADFAVEYVRHGETRKIALSYEVLSVKLDYRTDLRNILRDIERRYRMLSFDYLRKTYHGFGTDSEGECEHLVWWNVFETVQRNFIRAASMIVDRPHNRLRRERMWLRRDQLKRLPPVLEREFLEHGGEPARRYPADDLALRDDTEENRFLKFAVTSVRETFLALKGKIERHFEAPGRTLPEGKRKELAEEAETLDRLAASPFFRRIGPFRGLRGENLVLKQGAGYSEVYRDWILLNQAYSLHDTVLRMELKDIATLYEIWCFIEVTDIVADLLAKRRGIGREELFSALSGPSREMGLVQQLARGEDSKIILKQGDVELAEVIYNGQLSGADTTRMAGMEGVRSYTVPQRPDIVLRLTKTNVLGLKLTYLFDAKYRIHAGGTGESGFDEPPDDAINQMHRYRDAIYYSVGGKGNGAASELKKESVGGYILFPGHGDRAEVEARAFYTSIAKVNIGAFPLRPRREAEDGEGSSRELLVEFIGGLLDGDGAADIGKALGAAIPQHGLRYLKAEERSADEAKPVFLKTGNREAFEAARDGGRYFAPYDPDHGGAGWLVLQCGRDIVTRRVKKVEFRDKTLMEDLPAWHGLPPGADFEEWTLG